MCGIAGIVGETPLTPGERPALMDMLDRLRHRGPDDAGVYSDSHALLGHRRLSVIDLETGRQPLSNENETVHAVVNAEFYNYRHLRSELRSRGHVLQTAGDCECLLHLYEDFGEQCVDHLSGMFAFALWDGPKRKLILARDRLGVKPLYYALIGNRLAFASELKSLLALKVIEQTIEPSALADFLTYDFIPAPRTIFRQIKKLAAGTMLVFQDGTLRTRAYWDLKAGARLAGRIDDISEALWDELAGATSARMVADVPVGALLSGGLDSGAVATAMADGVTGEPIVTVTTGFSERGFDEREAARETAVRLKSRHYEHVVAPDAVSLLETLAWHFDEPFADPSAIPMYLLSAAARRHVTVALSGDGGDEVLAGYRRYRFDVIEERVRRLAPAGIRRAMAGGLARVYPRAAWLPRPLRAGATLENLACDGATAHARSIAAMPFDQVCLLLRGDVRSGLQGYDSFDIARGYYRQCDAADHLSKCQYVDIKLGLADGILTKVDRASMAHALEVRSPMLDYQFLEFAWRIPPRMRINRGRGKAVLRAALARRGAIAASKRPKSGFEVPLDDWMRGPLRGCVENMIGDANARIYEWLDRDAVAGIWRRHLSGARRHGPLLWKLMMLNAWAGVHISSGSARTKTPTASPQTLLTGRSRVAFAGSV